MNEGWNMIRVFSLFLLICVMALPVFAADLPSLISLESRETDTADYFAIQVDEPLKHKKVFMLYNPRRLVLDLQRSEYDDVALPSDADFDKSVVSDVRFGVFDATTTRLVFDLKRPISSVNLHHFPAKEGKPYHLMLEMNRQENNENNVYIQGKGGSSLSAELGGGGADVAPYPLLKPSAGESEIPDKYSLKSAIARKWKNKVPIIMIDAGHGGKDPGATGGHQQYEKEITLDYAQYLADKLNKTGRYKALLTRNDDTFIYLKERVNIAREAQADIFISLHADAAGEPSARGLSVYTVSEKASDKEAEALARQENKVDEVAGVKLHKDEGVSDILIDLAQRDTKNKSSRLADAMVKEFKSKQMKTLSYPHRYAGFRVLKAHDIPSLLIEMGFLTNEQDQKLLKTAQFKSQISSSIIAALDDYFGK